MTAKIEGDFSEIPAVYQEIFQHLYGELIEISEKVREYQELFGSEQRVKLLNSASPFLFSLIQRSFYDDLILSLSRLLDPAKSTDSLTKTPVPNLTFGRLVEMVEDNGNSTLACSLKKRLEEMRKNSEPLRKYHRNKRIGHNDYATAVAENDLLPPVSLALIEQTIAADREFLSEFYSAYTGREVSLEIFDECEGAVRLLDRLIKACAYDDLACKRMIPVDYHGKLAKEQGLI